jgi:eukaryotic-like serine/threonine-protein kinase
MVAFTAFQQNRSMLWIRSLDSPESRIIPGTEAANQVFWSPDSRSLGFFTTDRLWRVDLAGGPAQQICPVTIPMGGGSWGRSGIIVFSPRPEGVLYRVPASGGSPQPATVLDHSRGKSMHRSPEFLPDGKHFLYVANSVTSGATTLRIGFINSTGKCSLRPAVGWKNGVASFLFPGHGRISYASKR